MIYCIIFAVALFGGLAAMCGATAGAIAAWNRYQSRSQVRAVVRLRLRRSHRN